MFALTPAIIQCRLVLPVEGGRRPVNTRSDKLWRTKIHLLSTPRLIEFFRLPWERGLFTAAHVDFDYTLLGWVDAVMLSYSHITLSAKELLGNYKVICLSLKSPGSNIDQ